MTNLLNRPAQHAVRNAIAQKNERARYIREGMKAAGAWPEVADLADLLRGDRDALELNTIEPGERQAAAWKMAKLSHRSLNLRECESCDKRTAHYGRICLRCPDWSIWPERIAPTFAYGIEKADSRDVNKRLSDSWRINYKVSQSKRPLDRMTRMDAMLKVLYVEPIQKATPPTNLLDSFTRKAAASA